MTFLNNILAASLRLLYRMPRAELEQRYRDACHAISQAERERMKAAEDGAHAREQWKQADLRIVEMQRDHENDMRTAGDLLERAYADLSRATKERDRFERRHAALTAHAWARVLSWVRKERPNLANVLEGSRLVRFDSQVVEIAAGPQWQKAVIEDSIACLQDALYAFFRARPEVRVVSRETDPLRDKVDALQWKCNRAGETEARRVLIDMRARLADATGPWALILPEEQRERMASAIEWVDVLVAERDLYLRAGIKSKPTATDLADQIRHEWNGHAHPAPTSPPEHLARERVAAPPEPGQVWRCGDRVEVIKQAIDAPDGWGVCFESRDIEKNSILTSKWTLIGYQFPDGRRVMVGEKRRWGGGAATVEAVLGGGKVRLSWWDGQPTVNAAADIACWPIVD